MEAPIPTVGHRRRRRIRQLEHCNPAVFGNVCLTPYQDLNHLHAVHFLNVKMAATTSTDDLTSIDELNAPKHTQKQLRWINGQALILKGDQKHQRRHCHNQNTQHPRGEESGSSEKRKSLHESFVSLQSQTPPLTPAQSANNCHACKQDGCQRQDGDGASVCSCSDAEDFTNDAYYNLDFTMMERRRCSILVDQLLLEIYSTYQAGITDYNSATSGKSVKYVWMDRHQLGFKASEELVIVVDVLRKEVVRAGNLLVRRLKRRDALRRQMEARCEVITCLLKKIGEKSTERVPEFSPEMRFSLQPLPGDSGFSQWHSAMKMVSQLPEGIPPEFRRQLWLSLADKHLHAKRVDWPAAERDCFSEWSHPADAELGVQIVKDLHRTGCSLFCGKDGKENQALLKRVLLAYARWNKNVGYCQGFNMLAALILQVTEKSESDALKLMIYLIEGVLPDSYFADSLRGLSVDMAVFRELLRTKLPKLSKHLDTLQVASKEGTTSYEPPLTNVFTMQWFLTLFCNCLPQPTVLRVWDLILLEGNEILLRTSLAIWQVLADRIMTAKTADEFYCVMGMLMREILEFDLIDANTLVKGIVAIGPLTELSALREHYLYNINPWGAAPTSGREAPPDGARRNKMYHKDKLVLDIGVLKKQYTKLKQRQRQAHVIFNTAVARQTARPAPVAMNHLLLGKSALVPAKRGARPGPPKGAVPPPRHVQRQQKPAKPPSPSPQAPPKTLHWKDEDARRRSSSSSSSSSSDTELCDEPDDCNSEDEKCQLPDDNLPVDTATPIPTTTITTTATPPVKTPPTQTSQTPQTPPDVTNLINLNRNACSDIGDNVNTSDIHVELDLDLTDVNVCATSASAPPPNVIPDLLDFVEPPIQTPIATCFNIDEFLHISNDDNHQEAQISDAFDTLDTLETSSDIFPTTGGPTDDYFLTLSENLQLQRSDSLPSEDGFDFEKFLEERVKCLKDIKEKPFSSEESLDDTSENDRIKYARKNSVRALEIIQENSLILHRILQCQSRLTPSPPPDEDVELETPDYQTINTSNVLLDDTPCTPTPTNENPGSLNELRLHNLQSCVDSMDEQELIDIDMKTPEKLNVFRPYGDFSEFLLKYKSKTPELIDIEDVKDFEVNELMETENTKNSSLNIDTPRKSIPSPSKTIESPDLSIDYVPNPNDDLTSFLSYATATPEEENSPNIEPGTTLKSDHAVVESTDEVKAVEVEEDNATYLNRLISKYNFIAKQQADESDKSNEHIPTPDESERVRECDGKLEMGIGGIETKSTNFVSAPYRPAAPADANSVEVDYNLEKYRHKLGSPLTELTASEHDTEAKADEKTREADDTEDHLIEIDKNSKYNSILEYSRNLDEKFNNLILRSPKLSKLHSEGLSTKGNYSLDLPDRAQHGGDVQDADGVLGTCNIEDGDVPKASHSFQDFTTVGQICLPPKMASSSQSYIMTTEVDQQGDIATAYSTAKNTMDVDVLIDSPSLKSPHRIYNPFPVSISSRQSKEVPFRLGLYKK